MKKFWLFISTLILLGSYATPLARADSLLPPADVSCSVTISGARCGSSIIFTGSTTISGSTRTEWYLSILNPGSSPSLISAYGPLVFVKAFDYISGSVDLEYEFLLNFLKNDANGTVLVTARIFNSANQTSPSLGKQTYLTLPELKNNMLVAAQAKIIADANAKIIADANAKIIADALAKAEARDRATAAAQEASDAKATAAAQEATEAAAARAQATKDANKALKLAKEEAKKQITITCTKGKLVKKITAIKPKCPSGYKKK